jgi:hypothetical protein
MESFFSKGIFKRNNKVVLTRQDKQENLGAAAKIDLNQPIESQLARAEGSIIIDPNKELRFAGIGGSNRLSCPFCKRNL